MHQNQFINLYTINTHIGNTYLLHIYACIQAINVRYIRVRLISKSNKKCAAKKIFLATCRQEIVAKH